MEVNIHGVHYELTPGIRDYALAHLRDPLKDMWNGRAAALDIYLNDLHGPKGGLDKECRCVLHVPRGPSIVITEVTEDMRTSIHQARKRLLRRMRQYIAQKVEAPRRLRLHSRLKPENFEETRLEES